MRELRKYMCWIFAFTSLLSILIAVGRFLRTIHRYHSFFPLRIQIVAALFAVLAIVFGMAWWTIWKGKSSAKGWGIFASLNYLLLPLWQIIYFSRSVWDYHGVVMAIGLFGMIVFLRRDNRLNPAAAAEDRAAQEKPER